MQLELKNLQRSWVDESAPRVVNQLPTLGEFTADDLHKLLPEPLEPNWYGVLCAKLKNLGLIKRIGARPSARKERNGGLISVWTAA